jgi:hypothetical protein
VARVWLGSEGLVQGGAQICNEWRPNGVVI